MGGSSRGPLLLVGALAIIASVFFLWVGELKATQIRALGLIQGFGGSGTEPWFRSLGFALVAAAVLIIISAVSGSRAFATLASLVAAAIWGLWVYQEFNSFAEFNWSALQPGAWIAAVGIGLCLAACLIGDAKRGRFS